MGVRKQSPSPSVPASDGAPGRAALSVRPAGFRSAVPWLVPCLVAVVALATFAPALRNDFVNWDDHSTLVNNPHYRGFSLENLWWMITAFEVGHWRPLTWLSFAVDYQLWGMNPVGYHLTNVLLHAATAAVFCLVVFRLLQRAFGVGAYEVSLWIWSGVGALLFAVHPLRAECVAWATDRLDILSGFWWVLTVSAYLRADAEPQRRRRWMVCCLVLYACSVMSKGIGMTLPVVLLILDVYPLRRLGGGRGRWLGRAVWGVWLEKVPFIILGVGAGVMAFVAKAHMGGMLSVERLTLVQRGAQAVFSLAFYLWKTIWPVNLSPLYEMPLQLNPYEGRFLLSDGVVLIVTAVFLLLRKRWPAGLTAWLCYAVILLPVSGITQSGRQIAADRYSYLACLGWAVVAAGGLYWWWGRSGGRTERAIGISGVVSLLIVLSALSVRQTGVWRNSRTLWEHAISVRPCHAAYNNLGSALVTEQRYEDAAWCYRKAVESHPYQIEARTNLGNALVKLNRWREAAEVYEAALKVQASSWEARMRLYRVLTQMREFEKAITIGREGLWHSPNQPEIMNLLAWTLATCPDGSLRDGAEAVVLAQEASRLADHKNPYYLGTLAAALAEAGHFEDAVAAATKALALAQAQGDTALADGTRERLAFYEAGKPYHEP